MTDESPKGDGASGAGSEERSTSRVDVPSGTGPELDRLPPPVFPPGSRRDVPIRRATRTAGKGEDPEFDEAFISPDEPVRVQKRKNEEGVPDDAFISPDEPIVRDEEPEAPDDEEVQVTGIGDQEYARGEDRPPGKRRSSKTWEELDTTEMAAMLEELAAGLKSRGSTALLVTSEMTRFESMLRGFLAGYMVGRGD